MSDFEGCPNCGHAADGKFGGDVYIELHKCNECGAIICNECINGDNCPSCDSDDIWWNYDKAYCP